MHIVPIIKDGGIVKNHTEYAITNSGWKLIEFSLSAYLESLDLDGYDTYRHRFEGIPHSYLRMRNRATEKSMDMSGLLNSDPWGRKFVCFPPNKSTRSSIYDYYTFSNYYLDMIVNVIVTTVNGSRIYCVDIINESNKF